MKSNTKEAIIFDLGSLYAELSEPGYVGEFPDSLRQLIMAWLLAGIEAYREDDELMQLVRWLKYRFDIRDTSLTQTEIQILEQALGEEIDFQKDLRAQGLIENLIKNWGEHHQQDAANGEG